MKYENRGEDMNNSVSANELGRLASEIESKIKEVEEYISQIQKDCSSVIKLSQELESYEGKGVQGSYKVEKKEDVEAHALSTVPKEESWSVRVIEGAEKKRTEAAELNRTVANVKVMLINLSRLARKMQGSADDISLYQSLIEGLNWKDNDPIFSSTFDILAGHIAWDEYSAASGKFEGVDPNNIKYWTDKPLRFTRNETTGAYLIEQQDSDGNWVGMGFTDETTAVQYMKAFNSKVDLEDSSTNIDKARQEQFDVHNLNNSSEILPEETVPQNNNNNNSAYKPSIIGGTQQSELSELGHRARDLDDKDAQRQIIDILAPIAQQLHKKNGVKASVLIAQTIGESGWLRDAAGKNNVVSMNVFDNSVNNQWESEWTGESSIESMSQEVDPNSGWVHNPEEARNYPDIESAMSDASDFFVQYKVLGKNFANMTEAEKAQCIKDISNMSVEEYVDKIKSYATDSRYVEKIMKRINDFDLTKYDV